MVILFIAILLRIARTYNTSIDVTILLLFLFIGVLFGMRLVPIYEDMHSEFVKAGGLEKTDPFGYVCSSEKVEKRVEAQLKQIASTHIIILIVCVVLLVLLNLSYAEWLICKEVPSNSET